MPFSILEANVLRYFRSRERKFQGTKVSPMELSLPGAKVRGNESSSYRKKQRLICFQGKNNYECEKFCADIPNASSV